MRVSSSRERSRIATPSETTKLDAVATGIANFQASVESGFLPRALPRDGAHAVIIALRQAGFRITKAPTNDKKLAQSDLLYSNRRSAS